MAPVLRPPGEVPVLVAARVLGLLRPGGLAVGRRPSPASLTRVTCPLFPAGETPRGATLVGPPAGTRPSKVAALTLAGLAALVGPPVLTPSVPVTAVVVGQAKGLHASVGTPAPMVRPGLVGLPVATAAVVPGVTVLAAMAKAEEARASVEVKPRLVGTDRRRPGPQADTRPGPVKPRPVVDGDTRPRPLRTPVVPPVARPPVLAVGQVLTAERPSASGVGLAPRPVLAVVVVAAWGPVTVGRAPPAKALARRLRPPERPRLLTRGRPVPSRSDTALSLVADGATLAKTTGRAVTGKACRPAVPLDAAVTPQVAVVP